MTWMGLIATLFIVVSLAIYAALEPARQQAAQEELIIEAVWAGTDLYAQNCAICHGAAGEGIGANPGLDNEGVRGLEYESLFNVISRGRYNTAMPGWSVDEGGILTNAEVEQMVVFIQSADWSQVAERIAELGLTPPTSAEIEVPADLLAMVASLPGGDMLSAGLTLYAENCAACHGTGLEGSALAPSLLDPALLAQDDSAIARTISEGVPGTLMAGWRNVLSSEDIAALIGFIRGWEDLQTAGVALPVLETAPIEATPEMIAEGGQLFGVACAVCHGTSAQGTRMAPSLNNQTFLAETPDPAIYQIIAQGVSGTLMPAWGGRLADTEINAIVAYLRSLEPTAPPVASPTTTGAAGGGPPWLRNP
jgi:mono/diheme cytochrome c family protein